jgi:hypothetical protein
MPQNYSRNPEEKKVLDWSKSKQADNIKIDFEEVSVNVWWREFLEKTMTYHLPQKGMLISLQNMGTYLSKLNMYCVTPFYLPTQWSQCVPFDATLTKPKEYLCVLQDSPRKQGLFCLTTLTECFM